MPPPTRPPGSPAVSATEIAAVTATPDETIVALLERAGRSSRAVPIDKRFLQQGTESIRTAGPLAAIVRNHAERALDLLLLGHAVASAPPYDITEAADLWGRTLDLGPTDSARTTVSKTFRRLDKTDHLVERTRDGRRLKVTLLAADGSGDPYEHPGDKPDGRYLTLPFAYWEQGWHRKLSLPGKAFLLIALSRADGFNLPSNKGPDWYGLSEDTIEKGVAELREHNLVHVDQAPKKAPLAPQGYTIENRYTLQPPFGPRGVAAKGAPLWPETPERGPRGKVTAAGATVTAGGRRTLAEEGRPGAAGVGAGGADRLLDPRRGRRCTRRKQVGPDTAWVRPLAEVLRARRPVPAPRR